MPPLLNTQSVSSIHAQGRILSFPFPFNSCTSARCCSDPAAVLLLLLLKASYAVLFAVLHNPCCPLTAACNNPQSARARCRPPGAGRPASKLSGAGQADGAATKREARREHEARPGGMQAASTKLDGQGAGSKALRATL